MRMGRMSSHQHIFKILHLLVGLLDGNKVVLPNNIKQTYIIY